MSYNLFQQVDVGGKILKNRITMAPMFMAYANNDGTVSHAVLEHYRDMGASGAGMIVVENAIVDGERSWAGRFMRIDKDDYIQGLSELASTIKENGAAAFCQINHGGRYASISKPLAPSPVPAFGGPVPEEMSKSHIDEVIEKYANAAVRVKNAGFDGVEIHSAYGYLPAQFLSPRTNKRKDEYGGSLENRMRFGLRLVKEIRKAVGPDYPVGLRFMADEWMDDGLKLEEAKVYAQELDKLRIAYLSVTAGVYESMFTEEKAALATHENYMVNYAEAIKAVVDTPVIAAGRIARPSSAGEIIASGKADLIGLARVLLADPQWPQKAREGREEEINHCKVNCNSCLNNVMNQKPAICTVWKKERKDKFRRLLNQDRGK